MLTPVLTYLGRIATASALSLGVVNDDDHNDDYNDDDDDGGCSGHGRRGSEAAVPEPPLPRANLYGTRKA